MDARLADADPAGQRRSPTRHLPGDDVVGLLHRIHYHLIQRRLVCAMLLFNQARQIESLQDMVSGSSSRQRTSDLSGLVPSHTICQDKKPELGQGLITILQCYDDQGRILFVATRLAHIGSPPNPEPGLASWSDRQSRVRSRIWRVFLSQEIA